MVLTETHNWYMIAVKKGNAINQTIAALYGKEDKWKSHQRYIQWLDDREDLGNGWDPAEPDGGNVGWHDISACPHAINAYIPIPNEHAEQWPENLHDTNESMFDAAVAAGHDPTNRPFGRQGSSTPQNYVFDYHNGEIIGDGSGQIKSASTVCYEAFREVRRSCKKASC